jgi:oligoendopeptidase F
MSEPQRREALFRAFGPLWQSLNGDDTPRSPYRRMIRMAAAQVRRKGSPIDEAAHTIGISSAEAERWLERILDTWRQVSGAALMEPWDYRFEGGAAERTLGDAIPREALQPLSQRYYLDLGLDLAKSEVIYDLEPRQGKAPLAYTDYVRRGRLSEGHWQPTIVRVSGSYARGGLGLLTELVHENGHAAHMMALHTRPAFMDLGDAIFYEAFADVPAWSLYEPAWQLRYLGRNVPASASLRALYSAVMLDVAWALFDARMLRDPRADPNQVWTDITHRYLHVKPHPELAWWAVRVQLVHKPGYMVNYGLGAVITADIRQRIAQQLGPFATGDPRWYGWLSEHLLSSGEEHQTVELLREFLGRPVTPDALLGELRRIGPE